MSSLTNNAAPAMELLADVALHPAFKVEEVERIRKRLLTAILQEGDQPTLVAQRVGQKVLYGDQPYGFRPIGTTASVKAISRDDLAAFWAAHCGPKDAALVLAGDVTDTEARRLAERYFGMWKSDAAMASGSLPSAPAALARRIVIVDKPGAPQTALMAFGLGAARNTPDHAALLELNSVLGGLFSSRINMNLREKNGYTYGASSRFSFYREGGPFIAGGRVRTDVTGPATHELFAELSRIESDPASTTELKFAKDSALHSLPGDFETVDGEAGLMADLFIYGLPNDYYEKLPAAYEAVTAEAVAKAARDYIHPENMIVVAVGDRAKIQPELEKVSLGPIEIRDESGELIKQ